MSATPDDGSPAAEPLLHAEALVAGYTDVDVIQDVSISVGPAEVVCVIGPNGAGKSTLIKALAGLVRKRSGRVLFAGQDVTTTPSHRIVRRGLAYVPQLDNIFPNLTVAENLEMGAFAAPARLAEGLARVHERFPLLAERRKDRAGTLSGGQRQILALGRALIGGPSLLMLDEPSAGLAPTIVDRLFEEIARINESGIAVLLVEQNARRALAMAHRGYVLDLGRNRFEGAGRELLHDQRVVDLYLGGASRVDIDRGAG